jgi:aspartate/methionine/tyrosine aminotransferase
MTSRPDGRVAREARRAARVSAFTESVIREMTRLADEHGAINLAQGFPDFDAPDEIKDAARRAIERGVNQYPVTWGSPAFREAIVAKYDRFGFPGIDPETDVVVTCGSTEAMAATFLALVDPGQEVLLLEPFYENYGPDSRLSGADVAVALLSRPDWGLDLDRLEDAVTSRTRALVVNTPHNPTGHVFDDGELAAVADLAVRRDLLVFTDEVYEHIVYDGHAHRSIAVLPGMRERTVTISALSKTYSVTGWRVGWAIADPALMASIRKVHDFLTVAAAAPLQEAGITATSMPEAYYAELSRAYQERRDVFLEGLAEARLSCSTPQGAYYTLVDVSAVRSRLGLEDDVALCRELVLRAGVAAVPGSSFFSRPQDGRDVVRLAFPKRVETLQQATARLASFMESLGLRS